MKLQGMFAAAATPFDHTGAIYRVKVQHNVEKWCRTALAGFVFGSPTGEGALLDAEERVELWKLAIPHVTALENGNARTVIADVTEEGVQSAARLARAAAEAGAHAVVSLVPHQYRNIMYGPEAQTLFFRALADRSPVPVIIHNAPQWTGVDVLPETTARLSEHPNIAGVIETGTPAGRVAQIRTQVGTGFAVLSGTECHVLESLQTGANGAVLAIASAVPYAAIALWEAFRTREEEAAIDWQQRITHPGILVTDVYGVPGLKYAMDGNGYYGGPPRLPLVPVGGEARSEIDDAFRIFQGC